jgi:hypothetical protein
MVAPAIYAENLTISPIRLKILGADASTTIVDGGGAGTVFVIDVGAHVVLSKLTIRNGYEPTYGGGIINVGTLTINDSTITANNANYGGGGIENDNTLAIDNSTISGNGLSYEYGAGGGILNWGTLTLNRSTITANSASDGAGVYAGCCGLANQVMTINNSTISQNTLYGGGTGSSIFEYETAATLSNSTISGNTVGIYFDNCCGGSMILQNSIVANNLNCIVPPTSNGYNLSSDNTCNFSGPGDLNNTDPKLGMLGNHGGPTQTIPELLGSPTIDAGNPNGCTDGQGHPLTTDQRGRTRPGAHKHDQRCDMGAFELQYD